MRSRFFRTGGKSKCHGCRINGAVMPKEPVGENDEGLLQCDCKREEALFEEIYVRLGFIGERIAKDRKDLYGEKSGWKAISRPERERTLKLLELLGIDIDELLALVQV